MLNGDKIRASLPLDNLIIDHFRSIASTNEYLKSQDFSKHTHICITDFQSQGRGRKGNKWHSVPKKNACFSVAKNFYNLNHFSSLSLVMSLAVMRALSIYCGNDHLRVKWPNDVLYEGKKISGILIEKVLFNKEISRVIIGIGINVNMEINDFDNWTSVRRVLGKGIDMTEFYINVLQKIFEYIVLFENHGFNHFFDEWKQYDYFKEQQVVTFKNNLSVSQGFYQGIGSSGELILKSCDKEMLRFHYGEISCIRK